MIANINFSLFYSQTGAFGNVTGDIDVPEDVAIGDEVFVLKSDEANWFSGKLRVATLNRSPDDRSLLLGLDDVVGPSRQEAVQLVIQLEKNAGLFFDQYEY